MAPARNYSSTCVVLDVVRGCLWGGAGGTASYRKLFTSFHYFEAGGQLPRARPGVEPRPLNNGGIVRQRERYYDAVRRRRVA
jgi:hypothetical protein